jgi:hypothetical protein
MSTQTTAAIIALGAGLALVTVATLVWRSRLRRLHRVNPEARYRKDIQALKRRHPVSVTELRSDDVWSAGAASGSSYSKSKKAAAWLAAGAVGGCGGCGGCGCGG